MLGLWAWCASAAAAPLPATIAHPLDSGEISLPAELPAERTIVMLAFTRAQSATFDAWRPAASSLAADPGVDWLEVPFVDVGALLQGIIRGAMRRSLTAEQRAHTAVVWGSDAPTREALGIASTDEAVVVVMDRAGEVSWRHSGPPTSQAVAALRAHLGR